MAGLVADRATDLGSFHQIGRGGPNGAGARMHHGFEASARRFPSAVALECDGRTLSYAELDARANQLAHLLAERGVGAGSRVAILLARSVHTYVALLGVGKAGATFVPIDPGSPADRVAFVLDDADVALTLTSTDLLDLVGGSGPVDTSGRPHLCLDTANTVLDARPSTAPDAGRAAVSTDPVAYVIYTSGSSGRPKGVEVAQSSIANFLSVVPTIYDVRPGDRVHQGMTISFDFSIEEIWPTWAVGATVVAGPTDSRRLGAELADFLEDAGITVLYCVPTLLATLPRELPRLRSILVGGEACPRELVERWSRPQRRVLNTYGPTEATVTATWCELRPGRSVTIGTPLPTYTAEILDVDDTSAVPDGEVGEICLGGPGVALGYVNRPDLTAAKFVRHPVTGARIYRTGDLGRITADGEIEYLGRADAEVKVRGHRVDLGEIESVLLADPGVSAAAVAQTTSSGELAAYVVLAEGVADPAGRAEGDGHGAEGDGLAHRLHDRAVGHLPDYMVPTTLDVLPALPTQVSGKVDRNQLPLPSGRRLAVPTGPVVAAENDLEHRVAGVWAEAFGVDPEAISVEADFFDDLGGHSLLAARVISAMRERGVGGAPALRDLYAHPSVRRLAAHLAGRAVGERVSAAPRSPFLAHSGRRVLTAGTVQSILLYLLMLVVTLPASVVYTAYDGEITVGALAVLLGAALGTWLGVRWLLPVLLVRPLSMGIGPGRYPLWGVTYLRIWAADLLLGLSPLPLLAGSPMARGYLWLLGARVGRHAHVATAAVALPRLLRIGPDASIGYGAELRCWSVEDGWCHIGRVTVGRDTVVGANALLEPGASVGDGASLGAQSVLHRDQELPAGQAWAGSPAAPAGPDPALDRLRDAEPAPGWSPPHLLGAAAGLIGLELSSMTMIAPSVALVWWAVLTWGVLAGLFVTLLSGPVFVITCCLVVATGKRLVLPSVATGVHPLRSSLGVRKWIADKLLEFSLEFNNSLYATLWTTGWLRLLGARIGRGAEVSTVSQIDPDLLTIGHDSFVADMAAVGGARFARGWMSLETTEIGRRSFVGNAAVLPAGTGTGDDSLIGVLSVPDAGGVPAGSSWLGSPAIHLPRRQDSGSFDEFDLVRPTVRQAANRLSIEFVRATLPASMLGLAIYVYLWLLSVLADGRGLLSVALVAPVVAGAVGVGLMGYVVGVKRNVVGTYRPRVEPLWSGFVRRSEFVTGIYEAAAVPGVLDLLVGTPMLPGILRLFGAKIGRRVWLATTYLTEFDLVEISDDAAVGPGVSLQTHLFEDRVMKMSRVHIAERATVGARSIVLYDAVVGPGVSLEGLSLLMKGEHLGDAGRWGGIPAQSIPARSIPAGSIPARSTAAESAPARSREASLDGAVTARPAARAGESSTGSVPGSPFDFPPPDSSEVGHGGEDHGSPFDFFGRTPSDSRSSQG